MAGEKIKKMEKEFSTLRTGQQLKSSLLIGSSLAHKHCRIIMVTHHIIYVYGNMLLWDLHYHFLQLLIKLV